MVSMVTKSVWVDDGGREHPSQEAAIVADYRELAMKALDIKSPSYRELGVAYEDEVFDTFLRVKKEKRRALLTLLAALLDDLEGVGEEYAVLIS